MCIRDSIATVRNLWMAQELSRRQALDLGNFLLAAGNSPEALAEGQRFFASGQRVRPNIR